jgi:hypothetical protein
VSFFTRQLFGAGQVFGQPAPLPSLTSIYTHLIEFLSFLPKLVGTRNPP